MKKDRTLKTNLKLAEWWQRAAAAAFKGSIPAIEFNASTYKSATSFDKRIIVQSDFVMIDPTMLTLLSTGERKVVIKIMAELKRNNALWYCPYRNKGRIEGLISKLRNRNILSKTDNINMHLVNPWLIRRGIIPTTIAATVLLMKSSSGLDKGMVKDLKPPKKAELNGFYSLITPYFKKWQDGLLLKPLTEV